ncbi:MAG: type II secretion system protein [Phycisphaeraceae bacterium]|nr:type II secretion system protein [Phycisphaeraceae bacterium]
MLRTSHHNRALTLIEVLVVIVLISLLAGLGGGMYTGSYKRLQVEKAAKGLFVTARYARIAAIEHQRPYDLVLDQQNHGFMLTTHEQDPDTFETKETTVKNGFCRPEKLPDGVTFEVVSIESGASEESGSKTTVTFFPNGTADTAAIQLGNAQTHYSVVINCATGKASLTQGKAVDMTNTVIDLDAPNS